jgi:hypothetical protein
MIRGNIAIPDGPKSWRSRGRKRKSAAALAVLL